MRVLKYSAERCWQVMRIVVELALRTEAWKRRCRDLNRSGGDAVNGASANNKCIFAEEDGEKVSSAHFLMLSLL